MLFLSDAYKYFFGVDVCDSFIYNGRGQYDLFSPASSLVVVCLTSIYKVSFEFFYEFIWIQSYFRSSLFCFFLFQINGSSEKLSDC